MVSSGVRQFSYPGGISNATPPRVLFAAGSVQRLAAELDALGARRAVVVTTSGRRALGEQVMGIIGERGAHLLPEAVSQVPGELVDHAYRRCSEVGADSLVSLGGGAATGLAKGIALETGLPIVAVPTTYSGSEMTGYCGITRDGVKRMHESIRMLPSVVIYDARLTLSLPPQVTASSAFNALAHCIDAAYLPTLSPLLEPAAAEGVRIIGQNLLPLLADPLDLDLRSEVLYGAYLSGAVLTGGFALQHGLAHTLGGSFGIEHGLAHAIILPHVTAYLQRAAPMTLAKIADALEASDLAVALFDLLERAGLPTSLKQIGFDRAELDRARDIVLATEEDNTESPVPMTAEAVEDIFIRAFSGTRP